VNDTNITFRVGSLVSWRRSVIDSGRDAISLPSDKDLVAIARCPEVSKAALTSLNLERPSATLSYAAGILIALRAAGTEESSGRAAPRLPAHIVALLSPPEPVAVTDTEQPEPVGAEEAELSEPVGDVEVEQLEPAARRSSQVHVLGQLLHWREEMVRSGRQADSLPTDRDLVEITRCGEPKRPVIEMLDLDRPAATKQFGMGIVTAINAGRAAAASGSSPPEVPVWLHELLVLPGNARGGTPLQPPELEVPTEPDDPTAQARTAPGVVTDADRGLARMDPDSVPARSDHDSGVHQRRRSGLGRDPSEARPEEFARYEPAVQGEASFATCTRRSDRIDISWLLPSGPSNVSRIYRVTFADGYKPFSPEEGVLATTTETAVSDPGPIPGAVRYYAVWINEGRDETNARNAQPCLLAEGYIVSPPGDVAIGEDHGTVFGRWAVPDGVDRVEVQRIPAAMAASGTYLSQYSIARDSANLKGFSDPSCPAGSDVIYRVFAVVESDDGEFLISPPVSCKMSRAGVAPDMGEIEAFSHDDRPVVDLAWRQSVEADVRIFRTDRPPSIGTQRTVPISALETIFEAAPAEVEVKVSPEWSDGTAKAIGIPWPQDWARVYFTAVYIDRETAVVGPTATLARNGKITDAVVHQRVTWQQLSFNWPIGADEVRVHSMPPNVQLGEQPGEPIHIVTFDEHRELGAIRFTGQRGLPKEGCDLYLQPVTYNVEGAVRGDPFVVEYKGLLRIMYQVVDAPQIEVQGRLGVRPAQAQPSPTAVVQIATDWQPPDLALEFTMVSNDKRLPLWSADGEKVDSARVAAPPARIWTTVFEFQRAKYPNSLVRLFATNPGVGLDLAVLDPSLRTLRQ
jgi:hypothetical protein